jgi:hypothetical protein
MNMLLNDCYKYAAAINAKGQPFPVEPLIMALLLSQYKMIDWLTKVISKHESLDNNNKEVKESKQLEEQNLGKESPNDSIIQILIIKTVAALIAIYLSNIFCIPLWQYKYILYLCKKS